MCFIMISSCIYVTCFVFNHSLPIAVHHIPFPTLLAPLPPPVCPLSSFFVHLKKKSLYKAPGLYFVIATERCQVQLPFTITLDDVDAEKLLTLERRRILFISRGAQHTRQLASCPPPTAQVSPALCPSLPEFPAHLGRVHKHLPSISLPGSFGNQWVACL